MTDDTTTLQQELRAVQDMIERVNAVSEFTLVDYEITDGDPYVPTKLSLDLEHSPSVENSTEDQDKHDDTQAALEDINSLDTGDGITEEEAIHILDGWGFDGEEKLQELKQRGDVYVPTTGMVRVTV